MINVQRNRFCCGPVAVYNLCKGLGYNFTYQEVEQYMLEQGCYRIKIGTNNVPLHDLLVDQFDYRHLKASLKDLDDALELSPVIIMHRTKKGWHYIMVESKTTNGYVAYNTKRGRKAKWISRKELAQKIRYSSMGESYADMWVTKELI